MAKKRSIRKNLRALDRINDLIEQDQQAKAQGNQAMRYQIRELITQIRRNLMNVYEVHYAVETESYAKDGDKKDREKEWMDISEPIHVLANGDARDAITKAERHILRAKPEEWDDADEKPMCSKNIGFKLISVERVVSIDVE